MHLSWLDPHKMRKITVVGKEKMVVFDDMELERKVTIYEKGPWQPTAHLRRVADAHGRHLQPEDPERRAAAARVPRTSSRSWPARATATKVAQDGLVGRPRARAAAGLARRSARMTEIAETAIVYPGDGDRRGLQDPRLRRRRQAADPLAALDGQARGAAAARARRGHDRLDRRGRLRRHDGRRARDRRRPGLRARALHDRRRRRDRPRLAGRERHLRRRADEDPGARLHHRLLDCSRTTSSSRPA